MLSWIKLKRSDHPLDDPVEARKVAEEMAAAEPFYGLGQIASYLDAVKTAEKLQPLRAMEIIDLMDRTARVAQRRLNYEYATQGRRLTRFQSQRVWSTAYEYWVQLAEAYRFCLSTYEVGSLGSQALKPHLPKIIARTLRARGQQMKWALMRYAAVDPIVWQDLGRLYAMAEAHHVHDTTVQIYRTGQQDSSVQQEFLRVAMLAVSAPDALLPVQIEVADRLIALCANGFQIQQKSHKDLLFGVDLTSGQPPGRLSTRDKFTASSRFIGATAAARDVLMPLAAVLMQDRQVPRRLNLGIHPPVEVVLETVQHLTKHWSQEPPRRHTVRKRKLEKVRVVHDYEEVVANAGGLFLDYPFISNDETWTIENEGGEGFGAFVLKPHGTWLRAGGLIAVRREDAVWWSVGVVRRVNSDRDDNRLVGVQLLCQGGTAVTVSRLDTDTGTARQAPDKSSASRQANGNQEDEGEICVLLPSSDSNSTAEVTLLVRPGLCLPGAVLRMRAYDRSYDLKAASVQMRGEDYELVRFKLALTPASG